MESVIEFGVLKYLNSRLIASISTVSKKFNKECKSYIYNNVRCPFPFYKKGMKNIKCSWGDITRDYIFDEQIQDIILDDVFFCHVVLPLNLKRLIVNSPYINEKIVFPPNLEELYFGETHYNRINPNLPKNLKKLILGPEHSLTEFPDSLESLDLPRRYNEPFIVPKNLKRLKLGEYFTQKIKLPESLQILHVDYFNGNFTFPENLVELTICNYYMDAPLILPKSLKYVYVSFCVSAEVKLNEGLIFIALHGNFNHEVIFPKTAEVIDLGVRFDREVVFPENVKEITFYNKRYDKKVTVPEKLKILTMYSDKSIVDTRGKKFRKSDRFIGKFYEFLN